MLGTVHKENVCIWYDQCKKITYGDGSTLTLNCYNNTPSVPIADNSYAYDVLSEVCPWYISTIKPNSTRVCCSVSQMNTLKSFLNGMRQYFAQCPSCFRNLLTMFCAITCDPSNSLFMDVRNESLDYHTTSGIPAIMTTDIYFANTYANKFLNSCKDTVFSQRMKTIHRYCLNLSLGCSGQELLSAISYIDAISDYGLLNFTFTNYSTGGIIPKNMSAHNGTIVSCDQPVDGITCSFSNCPSVCPAHSYKLHNKGLISVSSVIFAVFVSFLMYNLVFIILAILYLCFTGTNTYSSMQRNLISSSKNDLGCRFELLISRLFSKWGCIAVNQWHLVVTMALISSIICCAGLMYLNEETDPAELWSGPDSPAQKEKEYFEKYFGPVHRTSQIIITAPNISNFSFPNPQNYEQYYHFGGIFQQVVLNEVSIY